ncbi:MAG TPA: DUF5722 domain-containing protein [Bacteroidales bacterium]|nr:DUF5722 domain-containing protein [Bacteroidales bacterium]HPJ60805.1 DUF5722 domain-containing protein [Bacteroidales bacterium]HPR12573.1 DUF5722 domain-containing protein [Bacteroidales bacterium]HRW86648.1 DUF5722 domain-containing protein [Bacteroidales bacterium]
MNYSFIISRFLFFYAIVFFMAGRIDAQAQTGKVMLEPDSGKMNHIALDFRNGEYQIVTTGADPWIISLPLKNTIPGDHNILTFEYFCPQGLDHMELFFGPPLSEARSMRTGAVGLSEGWTLFTADLSQDKGDWGKEGDWLRIDFGGKAGVRIHIRNIALRPPTEREIMLAKNRDEKARMEAEMQKRILEYLNADYSSEIINVTVDSQTVCIKGHASCSDLFLCEVAPYEDVTETGDFRFVFPVGEGEFSKDIERFSLRDGINYDRLLSKWVLAEKNPSGYRLVSHARYPDEIKAKYNLRPVVPRSRKGLGGFSAHRGHIEDLDELGISSATVNIWFTRFMFTEPAPGRIMHNYNGQRYYFREKEVMMLDSTFRTTAGRGIVTAGILLVGKAEQCPDPEIGRLLQHPDMDPAGIYSMPNMTSPESVNCYAAVIDFLTSRYTRPDKKYGMLNHLIIHNEVDAGWVWTNMGRKSALLYMDAYIKSMRLCYAVARSYNPHSEVFISLTHHWAWTSNPLFHPSRDLMEILLDYTRAEGDFHWAVAQHPYPQSLFEPKTWLDEQVDFSFSTPLITFKNLEVLDALMKKPEMLYQGKIKRTLWLSENGTNSRSYSEQDLAEQAAGFAYAWKKMKKLDGIDGFQWHNWFDHRGEGGLRLGLRKFPDDEDDPGGKKPVWYLYKAADTGSENQVFGPYKKITGIRRWNNIMYKGKIE